MCTIAKKIKNGNTTFVCRLHGEAVIADLFESRGRISASLLERLLEQERQMHRNCILGASGKAAWKLKY